METRQSMLHAYPSLQNMYSADDGARRQWRLLGTDRSGA